MITLKQVYYYNNRPCIPLALEHAGLYRCYINFTPPTATLSGREFCTECMAGHGYSSHTCEYYQDVIVAIEETIADEDIIFVPEKYLKEKPLEFHKYENILKKTHELEIKHKALAEQINVQNRSSLDLTEYCNAKNNEITQLSEALKNITIELSTKHDLFIAKTHQLASINLTAVNVVDTKIELSIKDFREIYINHLKMQDLEKGGIDNWSWYGDSVKDPDEYNIQFIKDFV